VRRFPEARHALPLPQVERQNGSNSTNRTVLAISVGSANSSVLTLRPVSPTPVESQGNSLIRRAWLELVGSSKVPWTSMALPRQLLIAVSLMSPQRKAGLDELCHLDPQLIDAGRLPKAIDEAVDDRLAFAQEFLSFGGQLLGSSTSSQDMFARNALARKVESYIKERRAGTIK